jgi:4-hydroxybenzoate polyprenyltransferase
MDFDRRFGLFSIPQRFGLRGARAISAVLHLATMAALIVFGDTFKLGSAYVCGVALFSLLLISQHVAIARRGTACIDQVFFTRNGAASVGLFLFVLVDRLTRA